MPLTAQSIMSFLATHWPELTTLAVVGWLAWHLSRWHGQWEWLNEWAKQTEKERKAERVELDNLGAGAETSEKRLDTLAIRADQTDQDRELLAQRADQVDRDRELLAQRADQADRDRESLRQSVRSLDQKFDKALDILARVLQMVASVARDSSPLTLTEKGEKVSDGFGAKEWAVQHAEPLCGEVEGLPEYKVYERCVEYVNALEGGDLERAKEAAYNTGTNLDEVRTVLSIELRDAVLARLGAGGS